MVMYHGDNRSLQQQFGSEALADRFLETIVHERFTDADKHVIAPDVLVFPDYDGNGMFKSLGNIRANPHVGLLFVSFEERRRRIRVNGTANLSFNDPLLESFPGGQVLVRVTPEHIFPNCPRYIPKMQMVEYSEYVPQEGCVPPEPEWKGRKEFEDVAPPRRL
jgi:uncharacterized protein